MKIIYTTLNNSEEARKIGRKILKLNLANCINFFPITCIYNYEGEITEEPEVVMIIKTEQGKFKQVEKIIKENITYTNFIGEFDVGNINDEFKDWLTQIVK